MARMKNWEKSFEHPEHISFRNTLADNSATIEMIQTGDPSDKRVGSNWVVQGQRANGNDFELPTTFLFKSKAKQEMTDWMRKHPKG